MSANGTNKASKVQSGRFQGPLGRGVLLAATALGFPANVFATSWPYQPALPAPTNLEFIQCDVFTADVIWNDNCSRETNYQLWYRNYEGTWTLYATLPANTTYAHFEQNSVRCHDFAVRAVRISNGQIV